jgi:hypothetical protein
MRAGRLLHGGLALALLLPAACPSAPGSGGARRGEARPPSASDLEGIELVSLRVTPNGPAAKKYGAPRSSRRWWRPWPSCP